MLTKALSIIIFGGCPNNLEDKTLWDVIHFLVIRRGQRFLIILVHQQRCIPIRAYIAHEMILRNRIK